MKFDPCEIDLESERFLIKIADLGFAREFKKQSPMGDSMNGRASSSPLMMPTEQIWTDSRKEAGNDHKINVWTVGVIFFQMLTGMSILNVEE